MIVAVVILLIGAVCGGEAAKSLGERLYDAAEEGDVALTHRLIEAGADVDWRNMDEFGETPLYAAAVNGHLGLSTLLLQHGADPNLQDIGGWTPLYAAAERGDLDLSTLLLQQGADPNLQDIGGWTPLYAAAQRGDLDLSTLLLQQGADPNLQDIGGETPLYWAAGRGDLDLSTLLLQQGADPNLQDIGGWTPLYAAAERGDLDLSTLLLQRGADPNVQNTDGVTPLYAAAERGYQHICTLLLQQGADPNVQDNGGNTALMKAVDYEHEPAVIELLRWGSDVTLQNDGGDTAWDLTQDLFMRRILTEPYCDPWPLPANGQAVALTTNPGKTISIACPYRDTIETYYLLCKPNRTWDGRPLCNPDEPPSPGFITEVEESRSNVSVTVSWNVVENREFDSYDVSIIKAAQYVSSQTIPKDSNNLQAIFNSLTPGEEYNVIVKTKVEDVMNSQEHFINTGIIWLTLRTNPNPVSIVEVTSRSTSVLAFSWNLPESGVATGYMVQLAEVPASKLEQTSRNASFSSLIPGNMYTLIIQVYAGREQGFTRTTSTEYRHITHTNPNAPVLNAPQAADTTITVTWAAPTEGTFSEFEISLHLSDCAEESLQVEILAADTLTKTYTNQQPGTIYCVQLTTIVYDTNHNTKLKSETKQEKVTTKPIRVASISMPWKSTTELEVKWTVSAHTGQETVSGYNITIEHNGQIESDDVPATQFKKGFTDLTPGKTYTIEVAAYVIHNKVRLYGQACSTQHTMMPSAPDRVRIGRIGAAFLYLIWSTPAGEHDGFRVSWKDVTKDVTQTERVSQDYERDIREVKIDGLQRDHTYQLQIRSLSRGEISDAKSATATTASSGYSLNSERITTNTINVSWIVPQNKFDSCELRISPDDKNVGALLFAKCDVLSHEYINLIPGKTYDLTIKVKSGGNSTDSTLPFTTKPSPVNRLSATTKGINAIGVSWSVNSNSIQNHFKVGYSRSSRLGSAMTGEITVNSTGQLNYTVDITENLDPGYTYNISVHGVSNFVAGLAQTTEQCTEPARVTSLDITDVTTTSVKLTYITEENSNQDFFEVEFKGRTQSTSYTKTPTEPTGKTLTVTSLFPGDQYTFRVRAVTGSAKGQYQYKTAVLIPLAPTPIYVSSADATSFRWTYDAATYHAQKFYLKLVKKGSTHLLSEYVTLNTDIQEHTFYNLTAGLQCTLSLYSQTYNDIRSLEYGTTDATVRCINGTYGEYCSSSCAHCEYNATCHTSSGVCPDGCEAGFYGTQCNHKCGNCDLEESCDTSSGVCPKECETGYYGQRCDEACGKCYGEVKCDKQSGTCSSGCETSYYGDKCDKTCVHGRFGKHCMSSCGHCQHNATCNKVNGTCSGCEAGYYGQMCDKACGKCASQANCLSHTGECPHGCKLGFHGEKCDHDTIKWIISAILLILLIGCSAVILPVIVRKYKHRTNQQQNTIEMLPVENFLSRVKNISLEVFENVMQLIIEPERVELGRQVLGEGNFGAVYKGTYNSAEGQKPIAAKTLKGSDPSAGDYCEFIKEATMMREFQHENVLTLYGVLIKENRPYVILPLMENGDLHTYLLNPINKITVGQMIQYALEIARGMNYLASMKFVHRDLAARNCMVSGSQLVKIADFGLARDIYEKSYYRIDDLTRPLPRKWLAIETLQLHIFSTQSDVWSFGVTVWEILMRGTEPYPDISSIYVKDYLQAGKRMDQPPWCPNQIYELMKNCWQKKPEDRPDFQDIQKFIEDFFKNIRVDSEHIYMEPVSIIPEGFTGTMGAAVVDSEDAYLEPVSVIPEGFTGTTGVTVVDIHE